MSTYLITEGIDTPRSAADHDVYVQLHSLVFGDPSVIPLTLYRDSRHGIADPLAELLLYLGRAQPTIAEARRKTKRDEAGRIVVALRRRRPGVFVFAAEHLFHLDVHFFANIADRAGIDLWFVVDGRLRPGTRAALLDVADHQVSLRDAAAAMMSRPHRGRRDTRTSCEDALRLDGGTAARCSTHTNAGDCVLAAYPDALVACRTTPTRVRHRLHQLVRELPTDARWRILAAARDPYHSVELAVEELRLSTEEKQRLALVDVAEDAAQLRTTHGVRVVPVHLRDVLGAFRDIRLEEGSPPTSPLLRPRDDGLQRAWTARRRGSGSALRQVTDG